MTPCDCQDPHGFTTLPGCDSIPCSAHDPIFVGDQSVHSGGNYGGHYGGHYGDHYGSFNYGWAAKGAKSTASTGKKDVHAAKSNNKRHKQ